MTVSLPSVEELNRLDMADFAGAMQKVLEPNPTLLERLARRRPFSSYAALLDTAGEIIASMSEAERRMLLASHPRIGARGAMSDSSREEQGRAGDATVEAELTLLQDEYERKNGFRFVVFVNARPRDAILAVLRERLRRDREVELATGIAEYLAIARDRLRGSVSRELGSRPAPTER